MRQVRSILSNFSSVCGSNLKSCPAIPFKKGKFKKYFNSDENWLSFHQIMSLLLRAHTEEMASAIQRAIREWLLSVDEKRAENWFRKTWCGERGNYTNAAAGYVGNNKSAGIESTWNRLEIHAS